MSNKTGQYKTSLQAKLIVSFLLVSFTVGILFTAFTNGALRRYLGQSGLSVESMNSIGREFVLISTSTAMATIALSLVIAFILSKGILKPLKTLDRAMKKVTKGDFSAKADIELQDELGDLARSFNTMTKQLSGKSIHIDRLKQEMFRREKIENDLRQSKERFTNLFENIKSGVAVYEDIDGCGDFVVVDFNKAAEKTESKHRKDVIGRCVTEVFPGIKQLGLLDVIRRVCRTGEPEYCKGWYQDDKTSGWRENYVYKLSTGHIVAVYDDITEQKEYEKALIENEKKFRTYVEKAPIGIFITDKNGNYTDVNPTACKKIGYSKEEMLTKNIRDICLRNESEKSIEKFQNTLQNQGVTTSELKIVKKDGGIMDAFIQAAVLSDDSIIGFCIDLTERKEYEWKLKQQKNLMNNIVSNIPYQVFWKDRNSVYLGCNRNFAEDVGLKYTENIRGKTDYQLWGKQYADKYKQIDRQIVEHGKSYLEMEENITDSEGNLRIILKSKVPLKDSDGNITGIVGLYTDITEKKTEENIRKELNEKLRNTVDQLRKSNLQLQEFTYMASHDLREPVRKISAFGELLAESLAGELNEDQNENLCFMIDGADRMQQMIEGLLTYSRVTTDELDSERVDLNKIISQIREFELENSTEISETEISIPQQIPEVSADTSQMRLLFRNILSNSIKYRKKDEKCKIVIRSFDEGEDTVRIEISDNGIGIKPEYHKVIFNMFRRLHPREEYEGMGMGLAVCKKIVERHGGQIGVKSDKKQGATFWVTLSKVGVKKDDINILNSAKMLK